MKCLFKTSSEEGSTHEWPSSSLGSKWSTGLPVLVLLGEHLTHRQRGSALWDWHQWKYPHTNPSGEGEHNLEAAMPESLIQACLKPLFVYINHFTANWASVSFSAEARWNFWLSARHIQEVSGTVSAWNCVKFCSNENTSPTVPAAPLCQNRRIIKERWINLL